VLPQHVRTQTQSCFNTSLSDIEVEPQTGEVYVQCITADPLANTTQGCNVSQSENFHHVWVAHAPPAVGAGAAATTNWVNDAHLVFDGNIGRTWQTNTDRIFATLAVDDSGVSGVTGNVYSVFP